MEVTAHGVGWVDCDFVVEDIGFFCVYFRWKYITSYIVCIRKSGRAEGGESKRVVGKIPFQPKPCPRAIAALFPIRCMIVNIGFSAAFLLTRKWR